MPETMLEVGGMNMWANLNKREHNTLFNNTDKFGERLDTE